MKNNNKCYKNIKKGSKAVGVDGIIGEMLRYGWEFFKQCLCDLFV